MRKKIEVSVIVCTRNRAEDLRQTLIAIHQLCIPDNLSAELIIVDNGSSDHTVTVVQECPRIPNLQVRYLSEPRKGLSNARNTGLAEAQGAIFLFTDDDVRPPKHWISLMCAPIIAGKAHAVAGDVVIAPHLERPWMQSVHRSYLASHEGTHAEPANMTGANMGFSREVLSQVPQFDTELGAGLLGCCEETLFSWQLKRAGYKIAGVPEASVEHHFDKARLYRSSFLRTGKGIGRSQAYIQYHWEHKEQNNLLLRQLRKSIQFLSRSWLDQSKAVDTEGIDPREMNAFSHLNMLQQYAVEKKRPRNYTQYGLIKRS